ncbi:MAG TPA: GtrA family protein [Anaerolineae bacterium]|nr:GtrA family protein [Anaerolineae bacterium]
MSRLITLAKTNRKEFKRFAKFLVVGIVGFVVDFGTFNLLLRALNFNPIVAQSISFTCAAISNFTWNRIWTYPESRSKPILLQFGQFFILNLIGVLVRSVVFGLLSAPMIGLVTSMQSGPFAGLIGFATNTLHMTIEQLGYNGALAIAVVVVLFWNFFSNRFITYGDVKIGH